MKYKTDVWNTIYHNILQVVGINNGWPFVFLIFFGENEFSELKD